jgi:hypothetical protein
MTASLSNLLEDAWHRLDSKHLLGIGASVSMRLPGTQDMLVGMPGTEPLRVPMTAGEESAHTLHAAIYRARDDVGAIAIGGGTYGRFLGDFGGHLPQVFDEQARHLGRTTFRATRSDAWKQAAMYGCAATRYWCSALLRNAWC